MLTLQEIRENRGLVIAKLAKKNFESGSIINDLLTLDDSRKTLQAELNNDQSELNNLSKLIGQFIKENKTDEANQAKERTSVLKDKIKSIEDKHQEVSEMIDKLLVLLPNTPHESVPEGKSSNDNQLIKTVGEMPSSAGKLPHWELAKKYNIIDFELGTKIAGAGFPLYINKGAKLQRALINFFLNEAEKAGYTEYMPPIVVNEESGFGTGQLPDKEGQMYHVGKDNLFLIPTAEVPVTNIFRDVIVNVSDFPIKCTAYTPCFRREAGTYGKDVRGLNRLHQFDKVEIVRLEHPNNSYQALEEMVGYVESLVVKLGLPYRILRLCGGDMSFTSALTYDFEVYSSAQERWLEVSSVSNFESYQANRLKLRFKEEGQKRTVLAHTLNGSALALPRIVAALLENNQTEKGIKIPECLVALTGFEYID
ncbi:MAG: serine--tRNA ligase [Bacteroidales bacterium]|nr:serine--tRNA ligase [Bacteroidales bacterium]